MVTTNCGSEILLVFGLTLQPIGCVYNQILEYLDDHAPHSASHERVLPEVEASKSMCMPGKFPLVIAKHFLRPIRRRSKRDFVWRFSPVSSSKAAIRLYSVWSWSLRAERLAGVAPTSEIRLIVWETARSNSWKMNSVINPTPARYTNFSRSSIDCSSGRRPSASAPQGLLFGGYGQSVTPPPTHPHNHHLAHFGDPQPHS